jgi:hypothetical protein
MVEMWDSRLVITYAVVSFSVAQTDSLKNVWGHCIGI